MAPPTPGLAIWVLRTLVNVTKVGGTAPPPVKLALGQLGKKTERPEHPEGWQVRKLSALSVQCALVKGQ